MMVADASAVLAIVLEEEDAGRFARALADSPGAIMSSVNYWEVLVRARRELGQAGIDFAEDLMSEAGVTIEPADRELARQASEAFERFHSRSGGRLSLQDCFAYALARREGDGLLFKGNNFPKTDVRDAQAG